MADLIYIIQTSSFDHIVGVQPICLPRAGLDVGSFLAGRDAIVIGWGHTERGRDTQVLQKVALPFVDLATCKRMNEGETLVNGQVNLKQTNIPCD